MITSINPTLASVNTEPPISIQMLRRMGFEAFCEGRSYFDMLTTPEREGWLAACSACADAETSKYLEAHRG